MGWSKLAEERIYDSVSDHGFFVGVQKIKIVGWGVVKKKCSQCEAMLENMTKSFYIHAMRTMKGAVERWRVG